MGSSLFCRVRHPVQSSEVWRKNQAVLHNLRKLGGIVPVTDIRVPEMQVHMASNENREVQDAEPVEPIRLPNRCFATVYSSELSEDWALEFNLTGGGS